MSEGRVCMTLARCNVVDSQHKPKVDYAHGIPVPERYCGCLEGPISAWGLPLGGDGVCPDLIIAGGGEREEYHMLGTYGSTTGLTRIGLPRYLLNRWLC